MAGSNGNRHFLFYVHILPILKTNKIKVPNNLETKAEHALAGVKKVTEFTSWFSHNSGGVHCDPYWVLGRLTGPAASENPGLKEMRMLGCLSTTNCSSSCTLASVLRAGAEPLVS